MVILIAGASHTGKTVLAQKLLERYGFPYLSIDHLKMGLIRSGQTALTPQDDDELTAYLWPILREMIKTAIENRQDLTVEGCYIPFDWQNDFDAEYLANIRYVCLVMTEDYIRQNFDEIKAHADDIERRGDDGDLTVETLLKDNRRSLDFCKKFRLPYKLIDRDYQVDYNIDEDLPKGGAHMLYHASPAHGLTTIDPRVSTHGAPYVYALDSFAQALVFGAHHDDFDFDISTVDGRLVVSECYPGALDRIFAGAACSIYELADDGFERGRTGWDSELVCDHAVAVVRETRVDDLLDALGREPSVTLVRYRDEPDYRRFVANHVVDRMIRFGVLDAGEDGLCYADKNERFATHYKRLVEALRAALDGSLL